MQSLSVSNLQVLEIDESFSQLLKSRDKKLSNRKLNYGNFKRKLSRYDSGYLSSNSAETIFSIDNNNYVSFRGNPKFKRDFSTHSLYDKSLLDLNEVFGVDLKKNVECEFETQRYNKKTRNKSVLSLPCVGSISEDKDFAIRYESRSWKEIYKLSDLVLKSWENNRRKFPVNSSLQKSYEYFQPNLSVKSSLLLNNSLLLQPLRRYTSEINLRKIHINREIFRDDFQIDSTFSCDEDLTQSKANDNQSVFKNVSEEILQLVLDLHEFQINDESIDKISEKVSEIDKYLLSHIKRTDIAKYLFGKNVCGCKLSSICSVISFSQALNQIINDVIDSKVTAYERIAYIIAFIKVSMCLYQKANWQSLNTLINSLHSFTIYRMNNEWFQIKQNHKHYFDEFVKLSAIIRSSETSILCKLPKGVSDIRNLLITQQINCCSKWDRMEKPAKWLTPPGIIDWLESELKNSIRNNHNGENVYVKSQYNNGLNVKNFICLIQLSQLPENWMKRSVKNIPLEYRQQISNFMFDCLEKELKFD